MQRWADRLPSPPTLLRLGLVAFVLAWLFGPYALRSAVPIWLPFLIALGLEVHFFLGGLRPPPQRRPDRGPQYTDRERYGYGENEELLLVREGEEELWIPYAGETEEELDDLIESARTAEEEPARLVEDERKPTRLLRRRPRRHRRSGGGVLVRGELDRLERPRRRHPR
jgi:hypothetical protein